ncbi:MAG: hypothetical protein AAFU67_13975, partial [Bacteroidota bacterium]
MSSSVVQQLLGCPEHIHGDFSQLVMDGIWVFSINRHTIAHIIGHRDDISIRRHSSSNKVHFRAPIPSDSKCGRYFVIVSGYNRSVVVLNGYVVSMPDY